MVANALVLWGVQVSFGTYTGEVAVSGRAGERLIHDNNP